MLFKIMFKKCEDTNLDLQNLSNSCYVSGVISVFINFFFPPARISGDGDSF